MSINSNTRPIHPMESTMKVVDVNIVDGRDIYLYDDDDDKLKRMNQELSKFMNEMGITTIHIVNMGRQEMLYDSLNQKVLHHVFPFISHNYCILTVFERMFLIPKQCLFRWSYFKNKDKYDSINISTVLNVQVFSLDSFIQDSQVLYEINYSDLDHLPMLLQNLSFDDVYRLKNIALRLRPFLDLILPPIKYWGNLDVPVNIIDP